MYIAELNDICRREGFKIWDVRLDGRLIRIGRGGLPGAYRYRRRMAGHCTVKQWMMQRFQTIYPDYTCAVLLANGRHAPGQMKLRTVRRLS